MPHFTSQSRRALYLVALLSVFSTACNESPATELHETIQEYAESIKRLDAFWAPYYGVEEDFGKFGDYLSPEYFERSRAIYRRARARLEKIDPEKLSSKDQRTYSLFKADVEVSHRGLDYPVPFLEFSQMWNRLMDYINDSSQTLTQFPFESVEHYDAFVSRSEGFHAYVDRQIRTLREGIAKGIVLNCHVARKTTTTYQSALEEVIEENPFWRPVLFMPDSFSEADVDRLKSDFRKMIAERILPGFQKFDRFFREEYLPSCREDYGIGLLPNGQDWYRHLILSQTSLTKDAAEIHEIGLQEVDRISRELEEVKAQLGFAGTLKEFRKALLEDPRYFFTSAQEMFASFKRIKEEIGPLLPQYFRTVPQSDYKIVESSNPHDAAARYYMPTDAVPHGRFVVNTKNLRMTPKYGVTTLSLHEAVPGHHFQLALQWELKEELSEYQRTIYSSGAFVEGWALYAEYLGREMGLYSDPLQKLGHLNDEMLRAVRLVVDTGIHALNWSREQTVAYMQEHLASDAQGIETEADRYSAWPGQALSYKMGQLKIIELRNLAERELGERFDIRDFHHVVLGNGSVSLPVLEKQVRSWIKKAQ